MHHVLTCIFNSTACGHETATHCSVDIFVHTKTSNPLHLTRIKLFLPFLINCIKCKQLFLSTAFNAPHYDLHFQQYNCWHLCPFDPYQALSEASHCPFNQLHLKHQTLWLAFSTLATCQTGSSHSHSWQLAFHFVLTWSSFNYNSAVLW